MARRLLRAMVAFGVVAVSALGGAQWARSQAPFPEGAFVVAQDGTQWVVGGSTRYRMSFVLDEANVVPTLRESSTVVSTVAEAAAALAGGAAAGAGAGATPATPAATLIGQRVATCFAMARYDVSVDRATWQRTAGGRTPQGNAMWAVLVVSVTNRGTDLANGGEANQAVRLVDERGREFTATTDVAFFIDVAAEVMSKQPYDLLAAGVTDQFVFVFPVAPDARTLTLRAAPFQCMP